MNSPSVIQIGVNRVSIDGTAAFVAHMQRIVIQALQDAPIGGARAPAPARRRRRAAAPKTVKRPRVRRGRVPGRTVNGKYIRPGEPIPAGYRELSPGGRIVAVGAGPKAARARRPKRQGLVKGSKLIDGRMYSPDQIAKSPELQRKLAARTSATH